MGIRNRPTFTLVAEEWLESFLKPDMAVFEWGSGGSTVYFADRVREVTSIEHNVHWYNRIMPVLQKQGYSNCECLLIPGTPTSVQRGILEARGLACEPDSYLSGWNVWRNLSFEGYVKSIDKFPDDYFDLVAIDGRARASCIAHGMPKVRPGQYLLLDNAARGSYRRALTLLEGWEQTIFYGPGWRGNAFTTTVWKKPVEGGVD